MNTTIEETTEITTEAIRLLFREMGVAKTVQFLSKISGGRGDYTKDRQKFQSDMSIEEIVAEIEKKRQTAE